MTEAGLRYDQGYVLEGSQGQLMSLETVIAEDEKVLVPGSGSQSNLTGPQYER